MMPLHTRALSHWSLRTSARLVSSPPKTILRSASGLYLRSRPFFSQPEQTRHRHHNGTCRRSPTQFSVTLSAQNGSSLMTQLPRRSILNLRVPPSLLETNEVQEEANKKQLSLEEEQRKLRILEEKQRRELVAKERAENLRRLQRKRQLFLGAGAVAALYILTSLISPILRACAL